MQAWLSRTNGGPDTLTFEDVPRPTARAGQLLIEVRAVGLNFYDSLIIVDQYQARPPRPFSPGGELAGIVCDTGDGTDEFRAGDHVIAFPLWGALAQYVAVDATRCVKIPHDLAFEKAAAMLVTYGTALYALEHRARLSSRDTLLILGAAGGVGLAAIDIAKSTGARIIAAVSSEPKARLAVERGAAASLIYPTGPLDAAAQKTLAHQFKEVCGGAADVVCDCIGGDYAVPALRALSWHGRYLIVGFAAGITEVPLSLPLVKGCDLIGVFWGEWMRQDVAGFKAATRRLIDLLTHGHIDPDISTMLPLAQGQTGIAALSERSHRGKIVVIV